MPQLSSRAWLGAALIVLSLTGCGGGATRENWVDRLPLPADTMTVAMAELGRHGGRFVTPVSGDARTFNPITANDNNSAVLSALLFVALTDLNYTTQADVPMLAKSWEFSNGERTLTFRLRRGACFSDGHPITSADVAFSFEAALDTSAGSPVASGLTASVDGADVPYTWSAPDSYTFVLTAPKTDALLLSHASSVRIVPKHVLEGALRAGTFASAYGVDTAPESLVTSGPFRLVEWKSGERTVLGRNPHWIGVDARGRRLPYLDEVVFVVGGDQESIALKFRAKEVDAIDSPKPEDYASLLADQKSQGYTVHDAGPNLNTNFVFFNLHRVHESGKGRRVGEPFAPAHKYAWFSNREFRRALSHAIDREAIIRGPMAGYGAPSWSIMTPGAPLWYDSTLTGADHDVARANALLDSLGLTDRNGDGVREDAQGRPVEFSLMVNPENKLRGAMAALLVDDFAKVGVRMTLATVDFNTLVTRVRDAHEFEACLLGVGMGVPADPAMGANFWKSTGRTHYWNLGQPEGHPDTPAEGRIDALFEEHVGTVDMAVRKARYAEMSRILNDECFVLWLPTSRLLIAVRNGFGNLAPSPMSPRVLWNADRIFVKK